MARRGAIPIISLTGHSEVIAVARLRKIVPEIVPEVAGTKMSSAARLRLLIACDVRVF